MSDHHQRARDLFQKYLNRTASNSERQEFLDYVDDPLYAETINSLISEAFENQTDPAGISESGSARVLNQIFRQKELNTEKNRIVTLWPRIAAAACIIFGISIGGYFLLHKPHQQTSQTAKNDIRPGTNGAVLILANGQKVVLGTAGIGRIANQNGTRLNKMGDSLLVYQAGEPIAADEVAYNTLETPKGKQYSVILPDGSKVWLNAASSLKYPAAFTGRERIVELTGEGYFEVVHNAGQPFKVKTSGQILEDIGTHFNINAYADEPVTKTTLVEGSVKVSAGNGNFKFLKPGQQSTFKNGALAIENGDTDDAIAWKQGYFQFNNDNLESGMRKIARWYNVGVVYNNAGLKQEPLAGTISRYSTVAQVLKKMELTGKIHFRVAAHQITIE